MISITVTEYRCSVVISQFAEDGHSAEHRMGGCMKRVFAIAAVVDLVFVAVVLYTPIKDFLWLHPWLLSVLAAAPGLVLTWLEVSHSGEANRLRREANEFRSEANTQRERANEALGRIADHTKRTPTKAERTAEKLRQYLRKTVQVVNADDSRWGGVTEIVEIKDEVVTLFSPCSFSSSSASTICVHCDDLEISEAPVGSGSLTLKVVKRYGTPQNLGQIKTWEDRLQPPTTPLFSKGSHVFSAEYVKPGSPERRRLDVYESADGQNFFSLEASPGETLYGNNVEISRHFLLAQLEYGTQDFRYNSGSSGNSRYPLYIKTGA
jgi:hypothetical protein